jgi:sulfatase modifying factor 1
MEVAFTMGSTYEQGQIFYDNEYPAHEEEVRTFYISKNEVTQEQYKAIMWNNPSNHKNCSRCPVEEVSWYDAQEFIKKLNELSGETYRLPSSVEWEYAARGGQKSRGYKYSGSNEIDEVAWYDGNSGQKTHVSRR